MLNIAFTSIVWVSEDLVGLLNFASLTLVLKDAATLLTPQLLLLLLPAPLLFVDLTCEERLNLVVLVVKLKFLLAHVRVSDAELSILLVGFSLLFGHLELFLDQRALVLHSTPFFSGQVTTVVSVAQMMIIRVVSRV